MRFWPSGLKGVPVVPLHSRFSIHLLDQLAGDASWGWFIQLSSRSVSSSGYPCCRLQHRVTSRGSHHKIQSYGDENINAAAVNDGWMRSIEEQTIIDGNNVILAGNYRHTPRVVRCRFEMDASVRRTSCQSAADYPRRNIIAERHPIQDNQLTAGNTHRSLHHSAVAEIAPFEWYGARHIYSPHAAAGIEQGSENPGSIKALRTIPDHLAGSIDNCRRALIADKSQVTNFIATPCASCCSCFGIAAPGQVHHLFLKMFQVAPPKPSKARAIQPR